MKIFFSQQDDDDTAFWINNPSSLDIVVDNGEASEIIVDDILCSFNINELESIFSLLASKIKKGGKLILYFTDIELLSHMLATGAITLSDFNDALCQNNLGVKSFISTEFVLERLSRLGFKINQKQIKNFTSIIVSTLE